jgi:hypothetical protein
MFAHPPLMRQSRRLTTDEWGEEHAAATLQTENKAGETSRPTRHASASCATSISSVAARPAGCGRRASRQHLAWIPFVSSTNS